MDTHSEVTNESIERDEGLLLRISAPTFVEELRELEIDWEQETANGSAKLSDFLVERKFALRKGPKLQIAQSGLLFLSRLCVDFKAQIANDGVIGSYKVETVLSIGKNSALFVARHKLIGTQAVLKVIRPGAAENLLEAVQKIAMVDFGEVLVKPTDLFPVRISDLFGAELTLQCIVFPFVEGRTLREFLESPDSQMGSNAVAECFVRQVGGALRRLEEIGAYHGDLHDQNVLVSSDASRPLSFKIVDVSFGAIGSRSPAGCINDDLMNFQRQIWKILSVQQQFLPRMSIRKFLGARLFRIISKIVSADAKSFHDVEQFLNDLSDFDKYVAQRRQFLEQKFHIPSTFRLQRYEEFSDPSVALRLFVPYPELQAKIMQFGNVYVSGNRGCGKSTYLAALAFFPRAGDPETDFRRTFGVYFPCRQGEFRPLANATQGNSSADTKALKHVVIVKIVRRVLELILQGMETGQIVRVGDLGKLRAALLRFTGDKAPAIIGADVRSEIANLVFSFTRVEMKAVELLGVDHLAPVAGKLASERDLIAFLMTVRATFDDLNATQFHILFDDAGEPFVPSPVQRVFNDLILASNAVYCIKFTAEKNTYCLESSTGKTLEIGQEYFEHDISSILFLGAKNTGLDFYKLEKYFRAIVERRLAEFKFQSQNIEDYLGADLVKYENLITGLAKGTWKNTYYCGWSMVWYIADRTPRNLLELVSEIFSAGGVEHSTEPHIIRPREQNRAIRVVSDKRLQSLSQIGGVLTVKGKRISLGRKLFEVTTVIGSTFKVYLKREREKQRKEQHLALERNDTGPISDEAQEILDKLVTFGVLDDAKMEPARDDQVKKPIYVLNRIFCPAFGIAFRRDRHLRLSAGKMEQLLLSPSRFMVDGTRVLRDSADDPDQKRLFKDSD